jgi:hypothetical protein
MGRMCAYWVGCALRGGARPVGRLGRVGEAARQAGPLRGPCENGERGWEKERLAGPGSASS